MRVAEFMRGDVTRRTFRPPPLDMRIPVDLWYRNSWAATDVVGERSYFAALRTIVGDEHRPEGAEHRRTATLVPEPDNPHDPQAVAVHIDAQRVGYLARADADRYHRPVADIQTCGLIPTVDARIWTADYTDWDDERGTSYTRFGAGVRITLDEPHLLRPANPAPKEPHVLLPHGATIQVHDTIAHLHRLSELPGARGEAWAHATLHHVIEKLPRSTRDIVEVRVDGARVGKLTPKMSGELLPAVRFLGRRGLLTTARLLVTGNRAAIAAALYVVRAHQLDDRWFDDVAPATTYSA